MRKIELYYKRDKTLKLLLIFAVLFGLSSAAVLCAGCTGTVGGPVDCCPTFVALDTTYDWICPATCPGGGVTQIDYTIEFKRSNNEECEPGDLQIAIRNVTDNTGLPTRYFSSGKGLYQGREFLKLSKDTEFELNVTTADCSGNARKNLTVRVVGDGRYLTVVRNGKLTFPDMMFTNIPVNAGPGVKVDKVENVNPFAIVVMKDSVQDTIPAGQNGTALRDQDAAGYWSIGLTNEKDFSAYNNQLTNPNLTVNVYLMCTCSS